MPDRRRAIARAACSPAGVLTRGRARPARRGGRRVENLTTLPHSSDFAAKPRRTAGLSPSAARGRGACDLDSPDAGAITLQSGEGVESNLATDPRLSEDPRNPRD